MMNARDLTASTAVMTSESLSMTDDNGQPVIIGRTQTGAIGINVRSGMTAVLAVFSGDRLAEFRELLNRAMSEDPT